MIGVPATGNKEESVIAVPAIARSRPLIESGWIPEDANRAVRAIAALVALVIRAGAALAIEAQVAEAGIA